MEYVEYENSKEDLFQLTNDQWGQVFSDIFKPTFPEWAKNIFTKSTKPERCLSIGGCRVNINDLIVKSSRGNKSIFFVIKYEEILKKIEEKANIQWQIVEAEELTRRKGRG